MLAALVVIAALVEPAALNTTSRRAVLPQASFVALVAMGQALVIRTGGIDLSVPAVMGMVGLVLRSAGGGLEGSSSDLVRAIVIALVLAMVVGLVNGLLIAVGGLNALIVTIATGALVAGLSAWYQADHQLFTRVPQDLADFGTRNVVGLNVAVPITLVVLGVVAVVVNRTVVGRRFTAAGENPVAANVAGVPVSLYYVGGYVVAALLYGMGAILLSAFFGSPTLDVGGEYLLTPIAAVVLAGGSLSGGTGSMISVAGAALFLGLLAHFLATLHQPTSIQMIAEGAFIATGMIYASSGGRRSLIRWLDELKGSVATGVGGERHRSGGQGRADNTGAGLNNPVPRIPTKGAT